MEFDFVAWLNERLPSHPNLMVGLGDDAAVWRLKKPTSLVTTTDMLSDGVDFLLEHVTPRRVGHKALGVNLSDLAAMGARPTMVYVSVTLPNKRLKQSELLDRSYEPLELAKEIYEGMLPLAQKYGVVIAGGDTNTWDGKLAISITAIGEVQEGQALRRSYAKCGEAILVTGTLGGSILDKHLDFMPRVEEAIFLQQEYDVRCAMDISDGLSLDLNRLVTASGCAAALELERVPIAAAAKTLTELELKHVATGDVPEGLHKVISKTMVKTPLEHALGDGEDFELLFTASQENAEALCRLQPLACGITKIGEIIKWDSQKKERLFSLAQEGTRSPLPVVGHTY